MSITTPSVSLNLSLLVLSSHHGVARPIAHAGASLGPLTLTLTMPRSSDPETRKRKPRVISRRKTLKPSLGKSSKPAMLQNAQSSNRPFYVPWCKATSGASYSMPGVKKVYRQLEPSQQHPGGRNSRKSSVLLSPHSSTTSAPPNFATCTLRAKVAQ